jgi:hypothetical protein
VRRAERTAWVSVSRGRAARSIPLLLGVAPALAPVIAPAPAPATLAAEPPALLHYDLTLDPSIAGGMGATVLVRFLSLSWLHRPAIGVRQTGSTPRYGTRSSETGASTPLTCSQA